MQHHLLVYIALATFCPLVNNIRTYVNKYIYDFLVRVFWLAKSLLYKMKSIGQVKIEILKIYMAHESKPFQIETQNCWFLFFYSKSYSSITKRHL